MLIDEFNKKIEKIENEYIFQNLSNIKKNRENEINLFFDNNINKTNDFNNNIQILHEISLKKGGFINIENRRKIYKYILNNLQKENNDLNNKNILLENKNYDNTIDADCERSILHKIINNNFSIKNYDNNKIIISNIEINNYLNELKKFTKESLENYKEFDYYQGYNEICLYFILLFGYKEGIYYMKIFSRYFLYYIIAEKGHESFYLILDILNDCCDYIEEKSNKLLNKLTRTKPYYSLSWIMTYFCHNNYNIFNQFRLLDYLITCNIGQLYFFCSNIIVYEFNLIKKKLKIKNNEEEDLENMEIIINHFQKIKIEDINIDYIINLNESKDVNNLFYNILLKRLNNINIKENEKNFYKNLDKKIFYYDIKIRDYTREKKYLFFIIITLVILILSIYMVNK